MSQTSEQNILRNILFILPRQMALGLFIYQAAGNALFRRYQWKGRTI